MGRPRVLRSEESLVGGPASLHFDEDALAGALLGGFDHCVELSIGDVGETGRATRIGEDLVALLDVGQAIVEQGEHVRGDLLAESVSGAEILIDPDLHVPVHLVGKGSGEKGCAPFGRANPSASSA